MGLKMRKGPSDVNIILSIEIKSTFKAIIASHMIKRILNSWAYEISYEMTTYVRPSILTHICLVDLSILINWMVPFPILWVSGVLFHFYFILK